ncbi:MAG: FAD-dependent oxidoreductase [Verrucomicrobiota bacterium]
MSSLCTQHSLQTDILVAGGGPAGVPCAIAAARRGAKVILCHDRPVLGGNASSEVRMHIVGANGTGGTDRGSELATEARESGIIEEIRLENCLRNPQRSPSMFDLILYEKCQAEKNLTLMLNTTVTGVEMQDQTITHAIADRPSSEDQFRIAADIFIDCTGDGRLGAEASAPFMEGRESRAQFDESLAPEKADQLRLGSTILMQAKKHDRPMPFVAPSFARAFTAEELRLRLYATPGDETPSHEYGYWWAEWGGELDTIKDNEQIRDQLLAIVLGIWDHVKNGPPGTPADPNAANANDASHWALDWFGFLPGKRESRRFIGQHILTQQDLMESRHFDDAIAYGGWSLDLHPPQGIDAPGLQPCEQHPLPHLYDIPLRSCVSRDIDNLMFAGRNHSATHVAFSSTRVMATCAVMGQGIGTAAAAAITAQTKPARISSQPELIHTIQQQLIEDDAFLISPPDPNSDQLADNLIHQARIHASSEQIGGEAQNLCSPPTRSVHGERGAPPDRCQAGSHRWMSDPRQALPATLEITWPQTIEIGQIHLVFDTGLHRHLTLSQLDAYSESMLWGKAQTETIKDYLIEAFDGQQWTQLFNVRDNYQRLQKHLLTTPCHCSALRITLTATNGLDHARICRIAIYS